MDLAFVHSIWTVLLVIVFVAIVAWAYSSKRKPMFEKAARMPLDDEHGGSPVARDRMPRATDEPPGGQS